MTKWIVNSKTIWTNIAAIVVTMLVKRFGIELDADDTLYILGIINIGLRLITSQPVSWRP